MQGTEPWRGCRALARSYIQGTWWGRCGQELGLGGVYGTRVGKGHEQSSAHWHGDSQTWGQRDRLLPNPRPQQPWTSGPTAQHRVPQGLEIARMERPQGEPPTPCKDPTGSPVTTMELIAGLVEGHSLPPNCGQEQTTWTSHCCPMGNG